MFFVNSVIAQNNLPPVIISEGNSVYCPQTEQNIVTSFNIEDPDDTTLDALYIQISEGYVPGEDQLIYNGSDPNLNTSWNVTEGKLEIAGFGEENLLISDIINAVYQVVFFQVILIHQISLFHLQLVMRIIFHLLVIIMCILSKLELHGYKHNKPQKIQITMDYKDI